MGQTCESIARMVVLDGRETDIPFLHSVWRVRRRNTRRQEGGAFRWREEEASAAGKGLIHGGCAVFS